MSNRITYSDREEAIFHEIVIPLEASDEVDEASDWYDIDSIADKVLGDYNEGYALKVSEDNFWEIVEEYAIW